MMEEHGHILVVDDNRITHWFEEPGINDSGADEDPYGQTSPEALLEALRTPLAAAA